MYSNSILRRDSDGTLFRVVYLGHWSEIVSVTDKNDVDYVKWYGDRDYVSAYKGETYKLVTR